MAHKFYPLTVINIDKTTEEAVVLSFEVKAEWQEHFGYQAGQYLTLQTTINGAPVRRSYSLCSSPLDQEWKVAVKKVDGGAFSTFANEKLKVGATLEALPPNGRFFTPIQEEQKKNYVAFAAGSGITPIISIIKTHLQAEPLCNFKLFYTNQYVGGIMLKEEIEALKNQYMDRFEVFHFLTQQSRDLPLFNGRMDQQKLDLLCENVLAVDQVDEYFICGPEEMIFLIRDYLIDKKTDTKKIHFELFGTEARKKKKPASQAAVKANGKTCEATIIEGGKSINLTLIQGVDNLLEAALSKSADLPFACKGGVCCTCKAKLLEGKVDMEVNYGLEPEEVKEGYILTCQSTPVSDRVVVDFDK